MKHKYYLYIIIFGSLLVQSCLNIHYLQKNEYLLADQHVIGNKKIKTRELKPYYLQDSNRKLLGMPIWLWIYELGRYCFDKKKIKHEYKRIELIYNRKLAAASNQPKTLEKLEKTKKKRLEKYKTLLKKGNFLMQIGQPPVIYTPHKRASTENNLLQYLHTKGYFDTRVTSRLKIKDKKVHIIYYITENQPFILKDIRLHSLDSRIQQLLEPYGQHSLLKKGKRYDQDVLMDERERIHDFLLNNGYWGFTKQYIAFNVDTTANNHAVAIETVISLPRDRESHPVYYLDSTEFSILGTHFQHEGEAPITHDGIIFYNIKQHFAPSLIANKIPLQQGQLYRKSDIIETQKRLTNLGMFRDIHVGYELVNQTYLKTHIHTSLLDKFQVEQEIGTEFTRASAVPFYQLSFKSRNLLKRLEFLSLDTKLNIEAGSISTGQQRAYNVQNLHIGLELNLPEFLMPLSASMRTRLDAYRPHTKVNLGYTITHHSNYWSPNFKTLFSYTAQPSSGITLECVPLSISFVDFKKLSESFRADLDKRKDEGDNSYKRYEPSLLTDSSIKATFKKSEKHAKDYSYLELLVESGGTLENLIDFERLFGSGFIYYKYLKFSIAYSQHIPIQPGTVFAYRLHTGVIYPYNKDEVAPLEKSFFIGGQNSIRAWGARSLGPGSYQRNDAKQNQFLDERPGEFILEANAELRQHLIGFVEGALFLDVGNVWVLHKPERPGEDFEFNRFYKEIAIGTGIGVRLNFNFLVLRLDVGFKLYDPAQREGARFFPETIAEPTFNVGLQYPF